LVHRPFHAGWHCRAGVHRRQPKFAVVFGISYPQWYETRPEALIIRSGLTTRVIRYAQIKAVRPSSDNRIAIDYGIGNLLIAPQQAEEFMNDIAQRAPQLSRRGQELMAAPD
jgi:hypothetical protein